MKREVNMADISDGKLYGINDMVKADCGGCEGCSACCTGMGESIILDPFDVFFLTTNLQVTFEELLARAVGLNVYDGIILPHLKMRDNDDACFFLDDNGRCSIHAFRPSICRLFPLGRYYEGDSFQYFLQIHECKKQNRSKVKVKNWIDIPDIKKHDAFILSWHHFVSDVQRKMVGQEEVYIKKIDMFILQHFFLEKYHTEEDFYSQFDARLKKARQVIK